MNESSPLFAASIASNRGNIHCWVASVIATVVSLRVSFSLCGRVRLLAMVTDAKSIARSLRGLGEPTDPSPLASRQLLKSRLNFLRAHDDVSLFGTAVSSAEHQPPRPTLEFAEKHPLNGGQRHGTNSAWKTALR